ncbi:MAG: hypothetical protein WC851_01975 [Candidatus Shapirobacteria bacterium]
MTKKILSSPLFFPLLIISIGILVAILNYTPGTFLTGWDTLHPEFNFPLNFKRLLFGVWRPEQGLGAVSGHSAMADLPRVFILWILHFALPLSVLRYSYIYLCLIFGLVGIYFLSLKLFNHRLLSFAGSIFYLLNLGTVQQFYVPFEMFPTAWAFLPWIILYSIKYLTHPKASTLGLFALITLFSTPQAYAAHLWYPLFGAYLLFLIIFSVVNKIKIIIPLTLILTTLFINSFWLLPNLYYLKTSANVPQQNQQNRLHSQEFLLKNRETGDIADSTLIRGFYLNWDIYNFQSHTFQKLMPAWRTHFQNFDVQLIGYSLFIFAFSGFVISIFKRDTILAFSPFFIVPFILLSNSTVPFSYLFDILLKVPLLSEILRFVFTKLSHLYIFGQAIFLLYFLLNISKYINIITSSLLLCASLIIYAFPIFQGQLISPLVRTTIPSSYFSLNKSLSNSSGRMLTLPLHNPSGWTYNSWGYQGSGFIWFGLPLGVLDRDSDRWELANEEAYREFYTALYTSNPNEIAKYLHKYKINYLLWDQSTTTTYPKNQDQITYKYEIEKITQNLLNQKILTDPQIFGSTILYHVSDDSLVQVASSLPNVTPTYHWHYFDTAYQGFDYQTDPSISSTNLSFRSIISPTNKVNVGIFPENDPELPIISFNASDIYELHRRSPNLTYDTQTSSLGIYTRSDTHGINLSFENLPHNRPYLVGLKSNYLSGIPLRFCFKNTTTSLCLVEDELSKHSTSQWDYFFIPPSDDNFGYSLDLNAISYAKTLSLSQIQEVKISPLPDSLFSSPQLTPSVTKNITAQSFFNQTLLKVNIPSKSTSSNLILNQSFNAGWIAFYIKENQPQFLTHHVIINNWANGWTLPSKFTNQTVYIFFWPQLLELGGLILVITTFIWIIRSKK